MFNNLIESSSHAKEFKRRGSFLLFTTATYLVLFAITGVVSIYAYDAHLESQSTELEITFVPVIATEHPPEVVKNTIRSNPNPDRADVSRSVRTELISSTSDPTKVPPNVGTKASDVPEARIDSEIGRYNADPPVPPGAVNRGGTSGGTGNTPMVDIPDTPPPPPEPRPEKPKVINQSTGVLKGNAISLPKPEYPALAKPIRLQGPVTVQILIDEEGNVVSAKVVSGHPILAPAAVRAAMRSRFHPTKLSGQPVKVSGLITYNFEMNH